MKKIMKLVITLLVILAVIGFIAIRMSGFPERPTEDELISFFNDNKYIFEKVATYLKSVEGNVYINETYGKDINSITRVRKEDKTVVFLIDESIKNDVKKIIYKFGFVNIYEDSGYLYFDKSVGFQTHQAIVFSKYGIPPPTN